jgi:hypothetical protein
MRFMMLMLPGEKAEAGVLPAPEFFAEMMKYNQALADAGVLLSGEGLHPTAKGARISFRGGKPAVTDGPFAETKEVIGGYWMIQVASKEEAVAWAMRCPAMEDDRLEIRQVQEMSDFPDEIVEAVGDSEAALRAKLEQRVQA